MYIEHFESFYAQAVGLYQATPLKTRFVTKYRHRDGKLTLKVTDDATVRAAAAGGATSVRLPHRSSCAPPCSACNSRRTSRQT